mmetsp:Transcript_28363/g.59623  ORF Transcript_28363/g.59623 Transcript_28363/m.59623 type:complete len:101 (+) Transcript_28363:311-613(+)
MHAMNALRNPSCTVLSNYINVRIARNLGNDKVDGEEHASLRNDHISTAAAQFYHGLKLGTLPLLHSHNTEYGTSVATATCGCPVQQLPLHRLSSAGMCAA